MNDIEAILDRRGNFGLHKHRLPPARRGRPSRHVRRARVGTRRVGPATAVPGARAIAVRDFAVRDFAVRDFAVRDFAVRDFAVAAALAIQAFGTGAGRCRGSSAW